MNDSLLYSIEIIYLFQISKILLFSSVEIELISSQQNFSLTICAQFTLFYSLLVLTYISLLIACNVAILSQDLIFFSYLLPLQSLLLLSLPILPQIVGQLIDIDYLLTYFQHYSQQILVSQILTETFLFKLIFLTHENLLMIFY